MAERSTAAVGVTHSGGGHEPPPAGKAGEVTVDGGTEEHSSQDTSGATEEKAATEEPPAPELHSGHKIARRYRLEECVTRLDGFSSWRAVDEKLRRAVGVHILPAGHPRARRVLAAARSAALLGDPRFVQVLDAVEDGDLVYVVNEWLPDATPLTELLVGAPLPAHEAYQLVTQLAQALAAAHREGLSHLRLTPASVLRTGSGQYRIRGLAVSAALRGVTSDHPQRTDTEAIGTLLYASLTQRWPYEEDAYGLTGVGNLAKGTLVAPDQVRAGVHRGLSELAMRALVNDGATASREEQPCATPEELAKAVALLPRIRPPEQHFAAPPGFRHTTHQHGTYAPAAGAGGGGRPGAHTAETTPPALPGRTGKALKWGVSALLIAALGLGSWQVSEALMNRDSPTDNTSAQPEEEPEDGTGGPPIEIAGVTTFDPEGNGTENPETAMRAFDGDPQSFWYTQNYYDPLRMLKPGVGLVLDLGKRQQVGNVKVYFEGRTSAELLLAPESTVGMPTSYASFDRVTRATGPELSYEAGEPVTTQYVLVWLTELPQATDGNYRGRITEIQVSG
ncbi:serine/threonine protein kinase [Streptomyces sp. RKND-216]|uniref:protein kinase family protein n=1 Tax=Streptomyces sp. RKND-216 TaxID=2562581 RepID=UPI00109DB8AD|nr:protein kinase family protein [Streptomyces sp. RKND-216]THA25481.1 serine/threonine protein kinase [Streptomyces sp. RKND-216]